LRGVEARRGERGERGGAGEKGAIPSLADVRTVADTSASAVAAVADARRARRSRELGGVAAATSPGMAAEALVVALSTGVPTAGTCTALGEGTTGVWGRAVESSEEAGAVSAVAAAGIAAWSSGRIRGECSGEWWPAVGAVATVMAAGEAITDEGAPGAVAVAEVA